MKREKKKETVERREVRKSGGKEKKGFRGWRGMMEGYDGAVVNRKCDEERNWEKKDVLSERGH